MEELGKNIKYYRKRKNISLQSLANDVEVSSSFLSQIENGKNEPSLTTLKKIAGCLDVTVSTLLGENENVRQKLIKHSNRHKLTNLWEGINIEFLSAIDEENIMEACIHEVGDSKICDSHCSLPYSHAGQEFFFVLEGTIVLSVEEEILYLECGDSYYLSDCNMRHYFFSSVNGQTAKVLCVTTPPYFYTYE